MRQHAPSKCNVFLGGYLFHLDGTESKQLDVIVTTDTTPRYNFHNHDGGGKSFSPVEGTLGVVSIKSMLDKTQLFDALKGIASIPATESLEGRLPFTVTIPDYEDWPYKVIYATSGIAAATILGHMREYYIDNPGIPIARRPNVIHVAGKYVIIRTKPGEMQYSPGTGKTTKLVPGSFVAYENNPDLQAICWVLDNLQSSATASTHIFFDYNILIRRIYGIPENYLSDE